MQNITWETRKGNRMKSSKSKTFLTFLIPSLLGLFLFITPIKQDGNLTIPIAVVSNQLLNLMGDYSKAVICGLITISAVVTIIHKIHPIPFIQKDENLNNLFDVKGLWFLTRMFGFFMAILLFFGVGPEFLIGDATGGLVLNDLMPILVCVFLLAGLLLSLLLNFGLLDFFGALLIKIMRPVFNLPGRSALDCVASWLGDGSVGVLLTSKQYEEGFYSRREASVIATTFSAVSITFSLVVISEVGLAHMFLPFYLTVGLAGIVAAIIVPKLPPLSRIPDEYCVKKPVREDIPDGKTPLQYGMELAMEKASKAPTVKEFFQEGLQNVFDMWFGTLPVILALGTLALVIAEYTPVFKVLGIVFVPFYNLLQIPEAVEASQTVLVGFADMFLPSVIASGFESDMTKFVVSATSVTQLIYMSEIGSIIMGSKIPISLKNLFIIFLERTIVTLPVIALVAHLLF